VFRLNPTERLKFEMFRDLVFEKESVTDARAFLSHKNYHNVAIVPVIWILGNILLGNFSPRNVETQESVGDVVHVDVVLILHLDVQGLAFSSPLVHQHTHVRDQRVTNLCLVHFSSSLWSLVIRL
jgi:hypothetical protein